MKKFLFLFTIITLLFLFILLFCTTSCNMLPERTLNHQQQLDKLFNIQQEQSEQPTTPTFVRVTVYDEKNVDRVLYIRTATIISVYSNATDTSGYVTISNGNTFTVRETADEIMGQIQGDE